MRFFAEPSHPSLLPPRDAAKCRAERPRSRAKSKGKRGEAKVGKDSEDKTLACHTRKASGQASQTKPHRGTPCSAPVFLSRGQQERKGKGQPHTYILMSQCPRRGRRGRLVSSPCVPPPPVLPCVPCGTVYAALGAHAFHPCPPRRRAECKGNEHGRTALRGLYPQRKRGLWARACAATAVLGAWRGGEIVAARSFVCASQGRSDGRRRQISRWAYGGADGVAHDFGQPSGR